MLLYLEKSYNTTIFIIQFDNSVTHILR